MSELSIKPNDYLVFKHISFEFDELENKEIKYNIYKGKVIESQPNSLKVMIFENEAEETKIIEVEPDLIIKHYTFDSIKHLSLRLVLKDLWKDFIFREVKTVKTKDPYMITYQYVNEDGFKRTETFSSYTDLKYKIPPHLLENSEVHYRDYFGFTTVKTIRNNDIYHEEEIFFSKKCYSELNLNGETITGTFSNRRGFKNIPPTSKQYICGLVENGEKGYFYRKWFICSEEFIKLWTLICCPDHNSLKKMNKNYEYVAKSLTSLMQELDTSHYDVSNSVLSVEEKQSLFRVHNLENYAIYLPKLYSLIAQIVFNFKGIDPENLEFASKFKDDLLWMKRF